VENQNPSDPDYVHYYSNVALTSDFVLFSQEGENSEIEQQWKGEIERYIKIGGKKENFIDFINAAKTGFPDERSKEANDKVKLFREDFIKKASKEDIVHIMKLHENIRLKLEQSKSNYLAKGNKRAYQECSGRISRLYRGNQQLQLVLKRKSRVFAS
jgi:reverse gyrase